MQIQTNEAKRRAAEMSCRQIPQNNKRTKKQNLELPCVVKILVASHTAVKIRSIIASDIFIIKLAVIAESGPPFSRSSI